MRKITTYFKSKTHPRTKYKTERHRNGQVSCFCPGFVYNLKCWHSEKAKHYKQKVTRVNK